jgi:hypothetical protein
MAFVAKLRLLFPEQARYPALVVLVAKQAFAYSHRAMNKEF